jgi:hypothetical protein
LKILETLRQPYPNIDLERSNAQNALNSFWVGLFIFAFLFIFQPFGISQWHSDLKTFYLIGFGAITFGILLILKLLLFKVFPVFFSEENWTVKREISLNFFILALITLGNFVYAASIFIFSWSFIALMYSFITVLAIGAFPIFFNVFLKYKSSAERYSEKVVIEPKPMSSNNTLTLIADNEKDSLEVLEEQLLYIESADNYANVFFLQSETIDNALIRSSLSRLESQVTKNIVRCHRSFMVNLNQVEEVSGNAQGYKLKLKNLEKKVPVARKFSSIIDQLRLTN